MNGSLLDFYTIGIGTSSSHTVGPMIAADRFAREAAKCGELARLHCDLYGSLAATGKGHSTDDAILLGWMGKRPDSVDIYAVPGWLAEVREKGRGIRLPGGKAIGCDPREDIVFQRGAALPNHPNGMHFSARNGEGEVLAEDIMYSVGGGFLFRDADFGNPDKTLSSGSVSVPHPFSTAEELLKHCRTTGLGISDIAFANEAAHRPAPETRQQLDRVWETMQECVDRGCRATGVLPGGMEVRRRANAVWNELKKEADESTESDGDPLRPLDWVNLFALAVNEENAAGGRVVTAPTNGAAGIIPAVLHYAVRFRDSRCPGDDGVHRFLLTAAVIASLYKENASLSGADVGCQGEVGVACSMAAGALADYLGGTPEQVECAAEIGMEHNLGLTCDPVGGLVQIPCIERNAMGAVKAINAAQLAMRGDGHHFVSLDKVIRTMRDTGRDMMDKYKETSRGGLAVNVTEC